MLFSVSYSSISFVVAFCFGWIVKWALPNRVLKIVCGNFLLVLFFFSVFFGDLVDGLQNELVSAVSLKCGLHTYCLSVCLSVCLVFVLCSWCWCTDSIVFWYILLILTLLHLPRKLHTFATHKPLAAYSLHCIDSELNRIQWFDFQCNNNRKFSAHWDWKISGTRSR